MITGTTHGHVKGGAIMVAAAGCLMVNDALCKWLMPSYPAGEVIAIRGVVMVAIVASAALVSRTVARELVFRSYKLHSIRAALIGVSALLFLSGLAYMPLGNAVTLTFTSPLIVAALAGPVLGERVRGTGWIAIAVGFLGTVLVLNPSIEHYGWASVLPAMAGIATAGTDLMTRRMSTHETPLALALSTAVGAFLVGSCTIAFGWRWPEPDALAVIALAGVFFLMAYVLMANAFRRAPASHVAPFRYSALVWGIAIGFAVWGEVPDFMVIVGAVVIVASGVFLMTINRARS